MAEVSTALLAGLLSAGVGFVVGWFAHHYGEAVRRRADEACANEAVRAAGKARDRAMSQARDAEVRFRKIRKEHGQCSEKTSQLVRACTALRELLPPDADSPAVVLADGLIRDELEIPKVRGAVDSVERPGVTVGPPESSGPLLLGEPAGRKDDLKAIRGIGPVLERDLNGLGIFHFHQIARLNEEGVAWLEARLAAFPGRVRRDGWVEQAMLFDLEAPPKPATVRPAPQSSAASDSPAHPHQPRLAAPRGEAES